ncbi:ADP-ribosylation factor-like 10 isoform X2 [Micropterus dolomieu]|uniref:ADP-ribosylation factor-like 10 isoform X2 n=1 Tax=Micropterus dolomieu TaxID=147949 RepID=UPI001E8E1182|nr:ADP-ribosylation factor-like 10 isoform X2 [Micropterus dolomieu]
MVLLRHISVALTAAVAALGSALFIALNFFYKRRIWSPQAEYCTIKEEEEERGRRQVLVLGLDGAGKSSMLQGLTPGESATKRGHCRPTRGFNFMSLNAPTCQLDFLEIGGGEDLRRYWSEYLRRTHVLVYVVDSSDRSRLPLAKAELHRLLRVEPQLPVVVLGNKQVHYCAYPVCSPWTPIQLFPDSALDQLGSASHTLDYSSHHPGSTQI